MVTKINLETMVTKTMGAKVIMATRVNMVTNVTTITWVGYALLQKARLGKARQCLVTMVIKIIMGAMVTMVTSG
jgi:hypothetical protein